MYNEVVLKKLNSHRNIVSIVIVASVALVSIFFWQKSHRQSSRISADTDIKVTDIADKTPEIPKGLAEYGLTIAKLDLKAPIIPNVDGYNEKEYYKALYSGVAQFKNSRNPDENGNLFIFGHSASSDWRGDYKRVFRELNKLATGDEIVVYFNNKPYRYEVFKSFETSDTDWSIADPTPNIKDDKTLTLMTCFPPGTIKNRWAVFAKQKDSPV